MCAILAPTKTHPTPGERVAIFLPAAGTGIRGTMVIRQGETRQDYPCWEDATAPFPGRWFRVGAYRVVCVPTDGGWRAEQCDCPARLTCKHMSAIEGELREGKFDATIGDEYPAFAGWTDEELEAMAAAAGEG